MPVSISEERGLSLLTPSDQSIYSVGVSTAGVAEIAMASGGPSRHIIATTVDAKGVKYAKFIRSISMKSNSMLTLKEQDKLLMWTISSKL